MEAPSWDQLVNPKWPQNPSAFHPSSLGTRARPCLRSPGAGAAFPPPPAPKTPKLSGFRDFFAQQHFISPLTVTGQRTRTAAAGRAQGERASARSHLEHGPPSPPKTPQLTLAWVWGDPKYPWPLAGILVLWGLRVWRKQGGDGGMRREIGGQ